MIVVKIDLFIDYECMWINLVFASPSFLQLKSSLLSLKTEHH